MSEEGQNTQADFATDKETLHTEELINVRPPDSEVILLGCKDPMVIDLVKASFAGKFKIFVLNKDLFNRTVEDCVRNIIKWGEDQKLLEYSKKPENIQNALQIAYKLQQKVGEKWFTIKDIVDESNFSYKQAHNTVDLLFSFGLLAQDVSNKSMTKYLLIADPHQKLKYTDGVIKELDEDRAKLIAIRNQMEAGIKEGMEALKNVQANIEKDQKEAASKEKKKSKGKSKPKGETKP